MAINFPNSPSDGDRFSTAEGVTYEWDGTLSYWKLVGAEGAAKVVVSETAPVALPGTLWWDSAAGELYVYYTDADSSQWVPANAVTTVATGGSEESADFIDITANSINDQSAGRNLVHNGDFRVSQRNVGSGVTTSGYYGPDRWYTELNSFPAVSISSDRSDLPNDGGYGSALRLNVVSSSTNAPETRCVVRQHLEAQDVVQLLYGTTKARQVTVSFWVKSSLAGDFTVELTSQDSTYNASGVAVISATNTWEYKTVTFPINLNGSVLTSQAPATSGLSVGFWFGCGSDVSTTAVAMNTDWVTSATSTGTRTSNSNIQLGETDNATVRLTGVKVETGLKASPFEYVSYATELERCKRYYQVGSTKTTANLSPETFSESVQLGEMREAPTVSHTATSGTVGSTGDVTTKRFVINYTAASADTYAADWTADAEFES